MLQALYECLTDAVVRRFFCNHNIVGVTFFQSGGRAADEFCFGFQFANGAATGITHSSP